jgi:divalent metal cation (Fe/Co/Zn/Cd) transporter
VHSIQNAYGFADKEGNVNAGRQRGEGLFLRKLFMRENRVERWILFANIAVYGNIALAAGKSALGIAGGSLFLGVAALYNAGMALAKRTAIRGYKKGGQPYFAVGMITSVSGVMFMLYCPYYFLFGNPMRYTMNEALAIATMTFTEIGTAIYGIKAAGKVNNPALSAIKLTSLTTALVSLTLTQTAILSFAEKNDMSFYNGLSGLLFGFLAALIGVYMMIRAVFIKRRMAGISARADADIFTI